MVMITFFSLIFFGRSSVEPSIFRNPKRYLKYYWVNKHAPKCVSAFHQIISQNILIVIAFLFYKINSLSLLKFHNLKCGHRLHIIHTINQIHMCIAFNFALSSRLFKVTLMLCCTNIYAFCKFSHTFSLVVLHQNPRKK